MDGRETLAGRYELRGVLGRGGMAIVHDGWDTRLGRAVAIKLLSPTSAADPEMRNRFITEARAAAALNHPNIVTVHDYGEHAGTPFIVMERLPGDTLAAHIARGPLHPAWVRAVLEDILSALAVAHGAGVLHRDIKPGNVLISADGQTAKVADFGIAKTDGATAHTMAGQVVGTLAYLSPERLAGAPASVSDDLYAVGVLAYEALSGRPPYPPGNPAAPLTVARPDLGVALTAAVDRAISPDPRQRFSDAGAMRAALTGTARMPPMPAPHPNTVVAPSSSYFVPAPSRGPARRRAVLAAVGAVGALAIGAAALVLNSSSAPPPATVNHTSAVPRPPSVAPPPPPAPVAPIDQPEQKGHGKGKGPGHGKGHAKKGED